VRNHVLVRVIFAGGKGRGRREGGGRGIWKEKGKRTNTVTPNPWGNIKAKRGHQSPEV